ncbi:MAG: metallophosphoesterase [Gemmatimonadales bacterium]
MLTRIASLFLASAATVAASCLERQQPRPTDPQNDTTTAATMVPLSTPAPPGSAIFVGAGDIGSCESAGDEATAALLDSIPGTVFTLGDNVYESGTSREYRDCYDPSWGRHKARTKPSPGNHDYSTSGAAGYFAYFGASAGDPGKGYYSFDLEDWHIIALNSNIDESADSPQVRWLRADLDASKKPCTLAYWHNPRFSSGVEHGDDPATEPLWQALYDANAEIVLTGHDHEYERFRPQTAKGDADPVRGIREFVVGTGGRSHYGLGRRETNSEVFNASTFGVLKLTLSPGKYTWQFIPIAGQTFTDSGSGVCH